MMDYGSESEFVEFKETTKWLKESVKLIAAMLNKNRHATLYFGITDKGEVIGQKCSDSTLREIS